MRGTFLTSDTHYHHKNCIRFDGRPFADIEEMNRELIARHNSVVGKKTTCYILGDFAWTTNVNKMKELVDQLNGQIIIVKGNHDPTARKLLQAGFHNVLENHRTYVQDFGDVLLSHFPFKGTEEGEVQRYPHKRITDDGETLLLHGHVHTHYKFRERQINVGCMHWDYTPQRFEDILAAYQEWKKNED